MTINSEQIRALKDRYSEPETPNCRICGAKMSIQRASAGSLVYGCDGRVEGDGYAFKEGRDFADKHYEQSRETVHNTGDADVIALLAERDADKALIAELQGIRAAAEKLVRCKGRYHSEQNYLALAALFGVNTPDLPPLDGESRTLTVKLPESSIGEAGDFISHAEVVSLRDLRNLCDRAGITLVVEE